MLPEFWFGTIALLWAGFVLLEGFDFGVGMLLPIVAKPLSAVDGVLIEHIRDGLGRTPGCRCPDKYPEPSCGPAQVPGDRRHRPTPLTKRMRFHIFLPCQHQFGSLRVRCHQQREPRRGPCHEPADTPTPMPRVGNFSEQVWGSSTSALSTYTCSVRYGCSTSTKVS